MSDVSRVLKHAEQSLDLSADRGGDVLSNALVGELPDVVKIRQPVRLSVDPVQEDRAEHEAHRVETRVRVGLQGEEGASVGFVHPVLSVAGRAPTVSHPASVGNGVGGVILPATEPDAAADDREPSNIRRSHAMTRTERLRPPAVVVPKLLPSPPRGDHG